MKKTFRTVLLALLLGVALPSAGLGGVIQTDITVTSRPTVEGGWDLTAVIENTGNAETYDLRAFLFVDEWTEVFSDLGDNPPGEMVRLAARFVPARRLPGRYTGMVRLHFVEKSGRAHRVFHPFSLTKGEISRAVSGPDVEVNTPAFHPRAFWRPAPQIQVRFGNPHADPVKAHVQVFLPEGIKTPSPYVMNPVKPGAAVPVSFPLDLGEPSLQDTRFHVTAWYEHGQAHISRHLEGRIEVEEGPVMMKVYVVSALIVLVAVFLVLRVRGKRTTLEEP